MWGISRMRVQDIAKSHSIFEDNSPLSYHINSWLCDMPSVFEIQPPQHLGTFLDHGDCNGQPAILSNSRVMVTWRDPSISGPTVFTKFYMAILVFHNFCWVWSVWIAWKFDVSKIWELSICNTKIDTNDTCGRGEFPWFDEGISHYQRAAQANLLNWLLQNVAQQSHGSLTGVRPRQWNGFAVRLSPFYMLTLGSESRKNEKHSLRLLLKCDYNIHWPWTLN